MSGACIRVNSDGRHRPSIDLPFNWGTGGTVFVGGNAGTGPLSIVTSDPNALHWPETFATGMSGMDGTVTIGVSNGFTQPLTLTAWEWNPAIAGQGTRANPAGGWLHLGANAAEYNKVFDITFASYTFKISENTMFLIQADQAVTGQAVMDGTLLKPMAGEGGAGD